MSNLSLAVASLVDDFKGRVVEQFGNRLLEYTVFGSQARGMSHELSDVDVFIVIRELLPRERRSIYELAGELWAETGARISPLARSEREVAEMRRLERRLVRDIDAEGIRR